MRCLRPARSQATHQRLETWRAFRSGGLARRSSAAAGRSSAAGADHGGAGRRSRSAASAAARASAPRMSAAACTIARHIDVSEAPGSASAPESELRSGIAWPPATIEEPVDPDAMWFPATAPWANITETASSRTTANLRSRRPPWSRVFSAVSTAHIVVVAVPSHGSTRGPGSARRSEEGRAPPGPALRAAARPEEEDERERRRGQQAHLSRLRTTRGSRRAASC